MKDGLKRNYHPRCFCLLSFVAASLIAAGTQGCSGGSLTNPFSNSSAPAATSSPTPTPSGSVNPSFPPMPTATPTSVASGALSFSPASVQFDYIGPYFPTQSVSISKASAIGSPVAFSFSDPTVASASAAVVNGSGATFTAFGVARGTTTVTAIDGTGATGNLTLTTGICGRPEGLTPAPQLLSPKSGATGVSTNVGTLYFAVYFVSGAPAPIRLHMIVGAHEAFEAGGLSVANLPSGIATAQPAPSGGTLTYMSASVPTLTTGAAYQTQLYDDSCQPALIAGSFST